MHERFVEGLVMSAFLLDVHLPPDEREAFAHFTENLFLRELGMEHDLTEAEEAIADSGRAHLAAG